MAEAIILEFSGVGAEQYRAVNDLLGVDPETGAGDWPDGLLSHAAGITDDGTFVVTEVWTTREAQEAFLQGRLMEALGGVGVAPPQRVTWLSLFADHRPGN